MASHNIPNKFMRQRVYIIKFLKKFRYSPCLWNKQMPNFNDKRAKQEAVDSLIALGIRYDFVYSSASVKKKLRMYKNMFKRMQQRIEGASESKPYHVRLWYFKYLKFLSEPEDGYSTDSDDSADTRLRRFQERKRQREERAKQARLEKIRLAASVDLSLLTDDERERRDIEETQEAVKFLLVSEFDPEKYHDYVNNCNEISDAHSSYYL